MTTQMLIEWVELAQKKREQSFKTTFYQLSKNEALDLIILPVKPTHEDFCIALCLLVNYSDWH